MHKYLNCCSVPNKANDPDLSEVGLRCVVHERTACEESTDAAGFTLGCCLWEMLGDWRLRKEQSGIFLYFTLSLG